MPDERLPATFDSSTGETAAIPVRVLIPVWGARYIQQFCHIGLPSLLAPGNLPAFAREFECEVVFLTRDDDKIIFQDEDAFRALEKICPVEFVDISDLIADTTYAVTITAAYVRGMKSMGDAMLDTYFVYLVSDYLMADGSLRGLAKYIRQGYSGIQTGNFQAMVDFLEKDLIEQVDPDTQTLVIPPRDLVALALENLHPVTIANMVDVDLCHATHANRFFWRVDRNTLLGRFFLMHMICIRPETADFQIGSSCDYSFIPEMCPSGNIAAIEDSDDYLVVELQPSSHEESYLQPGSPRRKELVRHFSEWTTEQHRKNADYVLLFHTAELPSNLEEIRNSSIQYIDELKRELKTEPQPHRYHPYWRGAVDAFTRERARSDGEDDRELILTLDAYGDEAVIVQWTRKLYQKIFGDHPFVRPWHHAWPDYRHILAMLKNELSNPNVKMIVVSEGLTPFSKWLAKYDDRTEFFQTTRLITRQRDYRIREQSMESAFIYLYPEEFWRLRTIMRRVTPLIRPGGKIYVFVHNNSSDMTNILIGSFLHDIVMMSSAFFQPNLTLAEFHLSGSVIQILTRNILNRFAHRFFLIPVRTLLLFGALIPLTYFLVVFDNLTRRTRLDRPRGLCSSATFAFDVE